MDYCDNLTKAGFANRIEVLPRFINPKIAECIGEEALLLGMRRPDQLTAHNGTDCLTGIKLGRCATAHTLHTKPQSERYITQLVSDHSIEASTIDVMVVAPKSSVTARHAHLGMHTVINCIENSVLTAQDPVSGEGYISTRLDPGDAYIVRNPMWSNQRPLMTVANPTLQENVSVILRQ